ncbi:MAG: hypothetical protein SYR96_20155 [Actinomycetota bacterium]|nr:hypothetical protein [Actinomycetota bacterium]
MGILIPLVLALLVGAHALPGLLTVRSERRRLLHAPRLTVRQLQALDRLPKWVVLRAQTAPGSVRAPLSARDCAWYRLEAGRMVTVGSNEGQVLSPRYTETAPEGSRIPLADAGDPDTVVWLDEALARRLLDRKLAGLVEQPVREVVSAVAGSPFLQRLEAEGRLTTADLAPGPDANALGVSEFVAPPDTPVLVIGRPLRDGDRLVIRPAAGLSLTGTTTASDQGIEARLAARGRFWRRILTLSALVILVTCAAVPIIETTG